MSNASNDQNESLDFIDFYKVWRIIVNYRYFIVLFVGAVTALAVVGVGRMTPTYIATARVMLEEPKDTTFSLSSALSSGGLNNNDEMVVTEMEVIQSRSMIAQVIDQLSLDEHPAFTSVLYKKGMMQSMAEMLPFVSAPHFQIINDESHRYKMIGMFGGNLTVKSIPQTTMISISFESSSAELARDAVNTLADIYIKRSEQVYREDGALQAEWLDERLSQINQQLEEAELDLAEFIESNDLIVIDGVSGLSAAKIKQLKQQLAKEQARNLELSSTNTLIKNAGTDNLNTLLGVEYVARNPTIQALRNTQMQVQQRVLELSTMFGKKHPKMVAARQELKETNRYLMDELKVIAENTDTNLATSDHLLKELADKLQEARQEHQQNQKFENQFIRLTREIDSNRQLYEKLLQTSLRNNLSTAARVGFASMVDPAVAPLFPSKPKKRLIVAISIILALAFSITVALLLDALNEGFHSESELTRSLGVPLLGITPKLKNKKLDFVFFDKEFKAFTEAIRTIKTNLLLQLSQDPSQKLIAITSTLAEEGKSHVAMNLAFSLAAQGKVLLIDANLRAPSIGNRFGLPENHPGLVELLRGEVRFVECCFRDKRSGISILPAGGDCEDPLDLLFSPRFHLLLKRLRHHYRYVVIDSIQTESVSDAFVVAKKADSILYVVKASSTKQSQVVKLFDKMRSQGIDVHGVIATQVDVSKSHSKEDFANYYDYNNAIT